MSPFFINLLYMLIYSVMQEFKKEVGQYQK